MLKGASGIKRNSSFLLFAASQAFATAGDSFESVAAAVVLVGLTGSGLYAGAAVAFAPLCGVAASALAGVLGDRLPEKAMMIAFGIAKIVVMLLFISAKTIWSVYILLFLLALANIFYGVPARKIMPALLTNGRLLTGNSILNGISGAVFVVGPAMAGFFAETLGTGAVLLAAAGFHLLSTCILTMLPRGQNPPQESMVHSAGLRPVATVFLKNPAIRRTMVTFCIVSLASSATSLAFFPYAFDMLHIGAAEWGIMVSVYNGAASISSAFPLLARGKFGRSFNEPVFICCLFVADAWFSYSICGSFIGVLPLLAVEGAAYCLIATLLTTKLQLISEQGHMARMFGLSDLAVNASRLLGMGTAAIMLPLGPGVVFVSCGAMLSIFAVMQFLRDARKRAASRPAVSVKQPSSPGSSV